MFHNVAERRVREGVDVGLSQASAVQVSCGHVLMRSRMHARTHMRAVYAPGRRCRSRHCHVACCPSTHATACVPHQSQPGPGHQLQPGDNVVGVNRHTCMQLSGGRQSRSLPAAGGAQHLPASAGGKMAACAATASGSVVFKVRRLPAQATFGQSATPSVPPMCRAGEPKSTGKGGLFFRALPA